MGTQPPAPPAQVETDPVAPQVAEPTARGRVHVRSDPKGAIVFLDGEPVATTDFQLAGVAYGQHLIRLELAGHETEQVAFDLQTPELTLESIALKAMEPAEE
jgi:hypothetical protein